MPYAEIARATTDRGELVLRERRDQDGTAGTVLELRVNGVFVMDTVETTTERALATTALELVEDPRRVLIGGLGLGFTLGQVLADPRVEEVTVAEIEEPLVAWMSDGTVPHGRSILADDRARVVTGDVADVLDQAPPDRFDLVLLDVDNGPGYLVHEQNAALYCEPFLRTVRTATRGTVAIWSADEAPELERAMDRVFGACTPHPYAVRLGQRQETYWLYLSPAYAARGCPAAR